MTDEQTTGTETEVTEVEDGDDGDEAIERLARDMGWKPKDEYRGDPELWRPAKEWTVRGKEIAPYLDRQQKALEQRLEAMKAEHAADIKRLGTMNERALAAQRASIEQDYAEKKREAVQQGDTKAYDTTEKAEKAALKQFDDAAAKEVEPSDGELSRADQAVVQTFWNANQRILQSPKLRGAADEAWFEVQSEMNGASIKEKLEEVRRRVMTEFPSYFGEQRRSNGVAAVEGASGRDAGGSSLTEGSLWSKVPKEARATALHHIEKERLFDPPGAKKGEPLTPAQKKAAQEAWAEQYLA